MNQTSKKHANAIGLLALAVWLFVVIAVTTTANNKNDDTTTASSSLLRDSNTHHRRRLLSFIPQQQKQEATATKLSSIIPLSDICPAEYPPSHATLHDGRKSVVQDYLQFMTKNTKTINGNRIGHDTDLPKLHTRKGKTMKYGFWGNVKEAYMTSLWNADDPNDYIGRWGKSKGWEKPRPHHLEQPVAEVLEGDWVAFGSWFYSSYGHFGHDHLPTIGFLKSAVPQSTNFLFIDHPIARQALAAIDPTFYRRIKWIQPRQVYQIQPTGSVTIALRRTYEMNTGCCSGFDPLRDWLAQAHPVTVQEEEEEPRKKTIIYYQRTNSGTSGGRIMDVEQEQVILQHIQAALQRHHQMTEHQLVIFNGMDPDTGDKMTIGQQLKLFRSAKTIIGPEGSGISGNMAYTNPDPRSCDERVQLLEFIRGRETKDVIHAGAPDPYVSHYQSIRKWPIDYHNILYTAQSDKNRTFINLNDLDTALDAMWGSATTNDEVSIKTQ